MDEDLFEYFSKKYPKLLDRDCISFDCGNGWKGIIEELFIKIQNYPIKVAQLKEKFGYLRIYVDPTNNYETNTTYMADVNYYIMLAEAASANVCEYCGSKENITTQGSWLKTLCPSCRKS